MWVCEPVGRPLPVFPVKQFTAWRCEWRQIGMYLYYSWFTKQEGNPASIHAMFAWQSTDIIVFVYW